MAEPVTREVLTNETRAILVHLSGSAREGRSNHMADVREVLEGTATLEFAEYLKFLKKFNYITLNRGDHTLGLTGDGTRIVDGYDGDRFAHEIGDYFSHRLAPPPEAKAAAEERPDGTKMARVAGHDTRFVKYDPIGAGGLGTVFRGKHTTLGIDVAIKEIKDLFGYFAFLQRGEVARRLGDAVTAQAHLIHPAVVRILDLDPDVAHPFFVMELCEGGSLRALLEPGRGGLPEPVVMRWITQALHGLRHAHGEGLVHGNLKPENVLLDAQSNVKLGDFGLTSILAVEPSQRGALPQVFLSTTAMAYLAPEQLAHTGEVGPAADLYALGMILYELVVGQPPGRRAPLPTEVVPGLSPVVDELFDRLTRDRPEARFPDADAVLEVIGAGAARTDLVLWADGPELEPAASESAA